jgi:superfamily II RNA helicase
MVKICTDKYSPLNEAKYADHFASFSFPLSDFQKYAIEAIVEGHHALVTAHTGSGKTLPAEFAIQHFVAKGRKVIYTSPIKALSNQKYADLSEKYPHIQFGLMTGDIKTNPDADVLIMTTEILMNALFLNHTGGSAADQSAPSLHFQIDIATELACVVFDECHYINDLERGQVWEKSILMLPEHVLMVLLSATIDNPEGFAQWVESRSDYVESRSDSAIKPQDETKKQVYLASTNHRVVPLSHYGYLTIPESSIKLFKEKAIKGVLTKEPLLEKEIRDTIHSLIPLQNDKGTFNDQGYKTLAKMTKLFETRQIRTHRKHVLNDLSLFLRDKEMLPAIAFVFSRKQVEQCAAEITVPLLEDDSKIPYTAARECQQILRKLPNFQEYLELPEYQTLVKLLEKGIGIHHSGMIPILREIVEIMISKKAIKLLFATESFAIGLDCPIKTTVFTGLTKFDGNFQRLLYSHEYTQMAGRAGRRGIDTIGYVVHCNNLFSLPTATEYKTMLQGKPQTLESKFRISYSLILNLIKNGKGRVQDFLQFVEKSMIRGELEREMEGMVKGGAELSVKYESSKAALETGLRTPLEICRKYMTAEEGVQNSVNKKRKEFERTLASIRDEYKWVQEDVKRVLSVFSMESEIADYRDRQEFYQNYIESHIKKVCTVLQERGFIQLMDGGYSEDWSFTPLGDVASGLAEIHPLILSHFLVKWNWMVDFSPIQMVGLFACFTNVNVVEEERRSFPSSDDTFVKARIQEIHEAYINYDDLEQVRAMSTGIDYKGALTFDMTDFAMEWCDCSDEMDCKRFIQCRVAEKGISIGDFTKAMLKISTIVKELTAIAEAQGQVDFAFRLGQIDPMILKYVTTSQSLYV